MIDVAVIGALAGVCSAAIALAGFWLTLGGRIGRAEGSAQSALQVAAESEQAVERQAQRITMMQADFSLYRERALEKFVTHQAISEIEKRLIDSSARTETRLTDAIEGMNKRLDRLVEAALSRVP